MTTNDSTLMPPAPLPPPSAAELDAFEAWVVDGAQEGSCGDTPPATPPNPYDTPVTCSSESHWAGGDESSKMMNPGEACIACHTREREGPKLVIAGTVYPTAHEPDDCNGSQGNSDVYVEVTDAAGRVFELRPNTAGNFMLDDPDAFTMPYRARVIAGELERVMMAEQDDGDCNSCHTEKGVEGAPGRVMLP